MKIEIKKQIRNALLKREELEIEVTTDKNPTKEEIIDYLKKDKDASIVKLIEGNFGRNVFLVVIFVYDTPEDKEKIEYIPRKIRKKLEEKKKKDEEIRKKEEEAKKKAEEEAAAKKAEEEAIKENAEVKEDGN